MSQLKWQVSTKQNPDVVHEILVPHWFEQRAPVIGEEFEIELKQGDTFVVKKAVWIADGRSLKVGNQVFRFIRAVKIKGAKLDSDLKTSGAPFPVRRSLQVSRVKPVAPVGGAAGSFFQPEVRSPMVGKVLQVLVQPGQEIDEGTLMLTIEAMKMENRIVAEAAGVVKSVNVVPGANVSSGDLLVTLDPPKKS